MSEDFRICPYAGLRPFSEEESLYFKGRDEHIDQATKQLGKNKFLILTGASGDGKSSLVYAGIIPNARAGFLKSSFSNWAIADFRPERSPFHNLCASIAHQLGIPNVETVKSELSHGFSALVDLYKASKLYYDEQDLGALADDKTKVIQKRQAANLMIIADQFEEFFTNPENYHKGVPSSEANLVVNLLLETAQLALEQDLPIYVVITMRSDFIGQCAAFRGLPEYIGFSQFFVPRLNRKQLQEVIEEPASLNGDRISRRLTERLIHDMVEGTDQLPILQHALNQIWKMASDGTEEMDLIHYAMVGGMDGAQLPEQEVRRFREWFQHLPLKIRNCYDHPDLQNVLNTHANKLFNQAEVYSLEKHRLTIGEADARKIVETAFRCLTKIDNGRAVRNRMSLAEITAIIDDEALGVNTVGQVLDIFREPGNTLLKPYIQEGSDAALTAETVLDITHESLIRNWEHLGEWASEEYSNYSTYLDFEQQLNRWIASGKSGSFLLYIGPLTYFESWFSKAKPSAAWIARYLKEDEKENSSQAKSEKILKDATEFLHRSARKHLITRTVMRYGPRRIAAVLALVSLLVLSGFTVQNYLERRDSVVLKKIKDQTLLLASDQKIALTTRLLPVVREMELGQLRAKEVLDQINDPFERINFATGLGGHFVFQLQHDNGLSPEVDICFRMADSLLNLYATPPARLEDLTRLLVESNDLVAALQLRDYYSPREDIHNMHERAAARSGKLASYILKKQPVGFSRVTELNVALETGLNHKVFTEGEVNELLNLISPFQNPKGNEWLHKTFEKSKIEGRGFFPVYGTRFNGLYLDLAYLYASAGDMDKTLRCIDTLLLYNQNYLQGDFTNNADNAFNIPVYFYLYHPELTEKFVQGYCTRKNMPETEFYERLLARSHLSHLVTLSLEIENRWNNVSHNPNLELGSPEQVSFFYGAYRKAILRLSDPQARNFSMGLSHKNEGVLYSKRYELTGQTPDSVKLNAMFDLAMEYIRKVDSKYLNGSIPFFAGSFPRKILFAYPDFAFPLHPWEPRGVYWNYQSGAFLDYLLRHQHFDEISRLDDGFAFGYWISQFGINEALHQYFGPAPADISLVRRFSEKMKQKKLDLGIDMNPLFFELGLDAIAQHKPELAVQNFQSVQPAYLDPSMKETPLPHPMFARIVKAFGTLYNEGKTESAWKMVKSLPGAANRATIIAHAARMVIEKDPGDPRVATLLDSCRREMARDNNHGTTPRVQLAYALSARGQGDDVAEAFRVMKNANQKTAGYQAIFRSVSARGELYKAWSLIPENTSNEDMALFLSEILYGRALLNSREGDFWKKYNDSWPRARKEFLFYDASN